MEEIVMGGLAVPLLAAAPLVMIWVVGAVVALVRWRHHRTVSAVTLIALSLAFLDGVFGRALSVLLPPVLAQRGVRTLEQAVLLLGLISLMRALIGTASWGLILWAVFGWRKTDPADSA